MTDRPVSVVLAGIGGMGQVYVDALLGRDDPGLFRIAGAADPAADRRPRAAALRERGVPLFASLDEFYARERADLAVLSSPIQFHASQAETALRHGSHVLCEKPAAGTIGEARRMIEAERRSGGRFLAVGFQWSFSSAVQALKADVLSGAFGRPRRLRCLYLWPRDRAYYSRNDWAGRLRAPGGGWILDGPAQNAMAHDLHNMLYVLGPSRETSARPLEVRAELARAYPIEGADTCAARARVEGGAEVLLWFTHVSRGERGPAFEYEFERATVLCGSRTSGISARFADGRVKAYGAPDAEPMNKLWQSIEAVRTGARPACGAEAAAAQVLFVDAMHASCPGIAEFPPALVREAPSGSSTRLVVDGLDELLEDCRARGVLPSEAGVAWAKPTRTIELGEGWDFPPREGLGP